MCVELLVGDKVYDFQNECDYSNAKDKHEIKHRKRTARHCTHRRVGQSGHITDGVLFARRDLAQDATHDLARPGLFEVRCEV